MVRVAAVTPGRNVPSARFRVRQYLGDLRPLGIEVEEYAPRVDKYARLPGWPESLSHIPAAPAFIVWQALKLACRGPGIVGSWRHQATWLQRDLLPGIPTLEPLLRSPLVFDVDDSVWLKQPWGRTSAARIARRARLVIAGNDYVADWFADHAEDVRIVPTAIDCRRFRPAPCSNRERFTVGWIGTASNFGYLETISGPLGRFLRDHPRARLLIVAERSPRLELPHAQVEYRPWSAASEVEAVQEMDVGLMPLIDEPWARGKCSFKMLQYMACKLPTVVSPIGSNRQVLALGESGIGALTAGDWYDALAHLYRDRGLRSRLGAVGRQVAEDHYDTTVVARRLAEILHQVAAGSGSSPSSA
jgi:glycosyltransferase involved in cell wall biosynthesis